MFILMDKRGIFGAVLVSLWLLLCVLSPGPSHLYAQDRGLVWNAAASTNLVYSLPDVEAFTKADSWAGVATALQGGIYSGLTTVELAFQGGDRDSAQLVGLAKFSVPYGAAAAMLSQTGSPLPYLFEITKLYGTFSFPQGDLSLGRMILNYGKGQLFSPADLFSAVNLQDPALGRTGTDVIRFQIPLSDLSGLDAVSTLALPPDRAVFGGRAFASVGGWDLSAMVFQNGGGLNSLTNEPGLLAGLDWKGDLLIGFYGEALFSVPYKDYYPDPNRSGISLALGADYSWSGSWFCTVEYQGNFGQGPRFGQFQGDSSLYANLSWKLDDWTSANTHVIYIADTGAWQGLLSVNKTVIRRTSLSFYTAATHGDVRTGVLQNNSIPVQLGFGCTLRAAY